MRYQDLQIDYEAMADIIKRDCPEFLNQAKGQRLYRGMNPEYGNYSYADKNNKSLIHVNFRESRGPMTGPITKDLFDIFDKGLEELGFDATRSNSDLFTGDKTQAVAYGVVYCCFPLDGFSYTYNPNLRDYLANIHGPRAPSLYFDYENPDNQEKGARMWWDQNKDGYTNKDLAIGLSKNVEIMITGANGYYAIEEQHMKLLGEYV